MTYLHFLTLFPSRISQILKTLCNAQIMEREFKRLRDEILQYVTDVGISGVTRISGHTIQNENLTMLRENTFLMYWRLFKERKLRLILPQLT